ncbi:MAG TPA: hypothetical protein VFP58_11565, partial [Candidatus Eisenbacteria bacterium]|nr:hypothetical protein [Candidatus Eisenbacteria bacterium]
MSPTKSAKSRARASKPAARKAVAKEAAAKKPSAPKRFAIPREPRELELEFAPGRVVKLTNLDKPFWPELGITKRDLLQYYADIAPVLLPHLVDRAMVMKRYPNGAASEPFFMKRAPTPRPGWIETCSIT